MKSLLLLALGLARTVVLGARIEAERIVVSVRPYKREQRRCPVCGRACDFYDMANRGAPRLWRAMDLARSACYLEYAPCRVRCPEHGVRTEAVPWARHGARFTRDFEDWVAWLAVRCTASAVSELARVEWHSVGGVCRRVYAELEAARGASRFDGVRRIGIDETSYKKGHGYVTVVVGHDRGCLHLGARGHRQGRAQPVPRRAHARAEARHRGGDRRRREADRAAGQAPLPQREVGHGHPSAWSSG